MVSPKLDVFSFFPKDVEVKLRDSLVYAEGNRIDFYGDKAFETAWNTLKEVAWYGSYLVEPVGTPFLFVRESNYPVGTWIKYNRGNIFLLPGTEYDDCRDYPVFVETAKKLIVAIGGLTGESIRITDIEIQYG